MIRNSKKSAIAELISPDFAFMLEKQKKEFKVLEKKKEKERLSRRPTKQKYKDFMFNSLLGIANFFLVICGLFMIVSKAFEKKAYSFRPKLCLEDGICLNNSLIPYYNKNKMGRKLVEFATNQVKSFNLPEKVGEVGYMIPGRQVRPNVPMTFEFSDEPYKTPCTIRNVTADEIPDAIKANLAKISPAKKTFYNLKEDEYDRRAQELVDRKVEEINKEVGTA